MPRKVKATDITPPTPEPPKPPIAADAAVAVYKDKAGGPINTGLTEGLSNFATITAEARRAAGLTE